MMETTSLPTPENFDFPFTPYDIQLKFMQNIYRVIEDGKLGIFESPTGTGKTLSILCGALRWLRDHYEREKSDLVNALKTLEKDLENEKIKENSDEENWIFLQSKQIKIIHEMNELKISLENIQNYYQKLETILVKKKQFLEKSGKKNFDKNSEENENGSVDIDNDDENLVLDAPETDINFDRNDINDATDIQDPNDKDHDDTYKPTKIYICTRTHSQIAQLMGELRKTIFTSTRLRVTSLASRNQLCLNGDVTKLKNHQLINERCLDMQKKEAPKNGGDEKTVVKKSRKCAATHCRFYNRSRIEALRSLVLCQISDIEDLVSAGRRMDACPFYASRLASEDCELVVVPYNTVLHKSTREANGINLKNNVLIIDEAHNLIEAIAQMHNSELRLSQITESLKQLKCYKKRFALRFTSVNLLMLNQLIFVLKKLELFGEKSTENQTFTLQSFTSTVKIDNYNMFRIVKFCQQNRLAQKIRGYTLKYYDGDCAVEENRDITGLQNFLKSLKNQKNDTNEATVKNDTSDTHKQPQTTPLLSVVQFLVSLTYANRDGRIFLHKNGSDTDVKYQFLLLNAAENFKDIIKEARSVIVAGGTMKPIAEFRDRLFMNAGARAERISVFSCGHIIPHDSVLPIVLTHARGGGVPKTPFLFNYQNRLNMGDHLRDALQECCKLTPGGVVVFFPSYSYEEWFYTEHIAGRNVSFGRPLFREPKNGGVQEVERVLQRYADAIHTSSTKSALLFSVVGGKMSEGLNFSDRLGRCIVVVGMPYANRNAPDLQEKIAYLNSTEGAQAGSIFYENLCIKAVNQCIGRAVRHINDYATMVLLDERYARATVQNGLPDWIRTSLKQCTAFDDCFGLIRKFFERRKD